VGGEKQKKRCLTAPHFFPRVSFVGPDGGPGVKGIKSWFFKTFVPAIGAGGDRGRDHGPGFPASCAGRLPGKKNGGAPVFFTKGVLGPLIGGSALPGGP